MAIAISLGLAAMLGVAAMVAQPAGHSMAVGQSLASGSLAVQDFLSAVPRLTFTQAARLDHPLFVDVRRRERFKVHHIAGAISLPIAELAARQAELPHDRPIVFYCTCVNEHSSAAAAQRLLQRGYTQVFALQAQESEWDATPSATARP